MWFEGMRDTTLMMLATVMASAVFLALLGAIVHYHVKRRRNFKWTSYELRIIDSMMIEGAFPRKSKRKQKQLDRKLDRAKKANAAVIEQRLRDNGGYARYPVN